MMLKIRNDEPTFVTHQCSEERKGKDMTAEELRSFAVEVLMNDYAETGALIVKHEKQADNEADFCFVNSENAQQFRSGDKRKSINVLVVYREEINQDISDIDVSWIVDEYMRTGAIPRVTMATAWCAEAQSEDGRPAICGGEFCFKFYSVSPLPDEINEPMEKELSAVELAVKYEEAWRLLDASVVAPFLDKDFHYGSKWVFDEMPSRKEYIEYFTGKLAAIRRTASHIDIAIGRNHQNGNVAVLLVQNGCHYVLELTTENGRITSAYMNEYDSRYKVFNAEDELYQNHGDHNDCIIPVEKLFDSTIHDILAESDVWRICDTQVTNEEMYEKETCVFSLVYGKEDIKMLSTFAVSEKTNHNFFMSIYPITKGVPVEVEIDKVIEWDNQIEATVLCSVGEFKFAFFAIDYYCNKERYREGVRITVDLSALGMKVEEARRSFQFEGQEAIDWLAKIGEKPTYDENNNVEPVRIDLEHLVAFLNMDSKCPDEAEFQSPVEEIISMSVLGVDFYKTTVKICRQLTDDGALDVSIPLYFRQDFIPEVKEGDPVRGWMWVTGCVTGEHDTSNIVTYKRSVGDIGAEFEEFMSGINCERFSNLMSVIEKLPELKIREGYEFDAFQSGGLHGWTFQAYCCKEGASVCYDPSVHGEYDDSLRICDRIDPIEARRVPDPLIYFDVPFTKTGIMQAWLLDNISDFLPKGWHANYSVKYFIFNAERIDELFPEKVDSDDGLDDCLASYRLRVRRSVLALDRERILPSISIDGDKAVLSYTYWNDWKGLVKVKTHAIRVGEGIKFLKPEEEVIIRYECGICF